MESQEGVGGSGWPWGNKKGCFCWTIPLSPAFHQIKHFRIWIVYVVLVSAGCLCDRWGEDPGARRPGLQRNGHPSRQTGPLHSLWRGATTAVPACHAGRGHRQWGMNQGRNFHDTVEQLFFYIQSPTCQIPFHTFNSTWQHEQLPPQLSSVLWNRCETASCFQPGPFLAHVSWPCSVGLFTKWTEQIRQMWKDLLHMEPYYNSIIPRGNLWSCSCGAIS